MYYTAMNTSVQRHSDREMLERFLAVAGTVEQRIEQALGAVGLSLARLGALTHLAEGGGALTLGELAERVHCARSNVTQLVDRLEAEGLVERRNDAADRRVIRAALTPQGREAQTTGTSVLSGIETDVMQGMSPDHVRILGEILASMG